jgi:NAD(P)-dependent dehydrogenase (short-subunit alcohol dehydrogenase family)
MDISGKTAIVTGAASGIGLGIATALAEAGANVVMADIQKDAVEQAAHGLSGTNKRVMPVRIDVTHEQSVLDALAEAERNFGKLHIACNNAGVPMHGTRMIDVPAADWEFVIGVNVGGSSTASGTSSPPSSGTGRKGMSSTPRRSPAFRIAAAPTRRRTR